MKKLGSLILAGLFSAQILSACNNTDSLPLQTINAPVNNISAQSAKGLTSFFTVMVSKTFERADANKDKYVSADEYSAIFTLPVPAEPTPAPADPAQPAPAPTEISAAAADKLAQIPTDPKARFTKMDKNKDGKLSMTEVKAKPEFFVAARKNMVRTMVKTMFAYFDTNKNANIARDEFSKIFETAPYEMKTNMMQSFYIADVNKNNALTFSEFEDMYYAMVRTYMENPMPIPSEPAQPVPSEPVPAPADPAQPAPVVEIPDSTTPGFHR